MSYDGRVGNSGAFVLFGNCIPVRGARRSVICDLLRRRLRPIPGALYEMLTEHAGHPTETIRASYPPDTHAQIDHYFQLLADEGYGFWTDEPGRFKPMSQDFDVPARCTNAIIDISAESDHDFDSIFTQLDELGCRAVQIRAHDEIKPEDVVGIVACAERGRFRHLDFILKASARVDVGFARNLCDQHRLITRVILHSAGEDSSETLGGMGIEILSTRAGFDARNCGQVGLGLFAVNIPHFTEARCANSCLNRKLSIAVNGDVMACPSMRETYGNARTDRLAPVLERSELRALWSITKDQVEVCRDCEFRYVCTDCRAHTRDGGRFSKPSSCTYNPYLARWE